MLSKLQIKKQRGIYTGDICLLNRTIKCRWQSAIKLLLHKKQ